jgi:hypothetical protein
MVEGRKSAMFRRKFWSTTLLVVGIALFLVGAEMRVYFSGKVEIADAELHRMRSPYLAGQPTSYYDWAHPSQVVEVISYSEKNSGFYMRYYGGLRNQPTIMTWEEAQQLLTEIRAKLEERAKTRTAPTSASNLDEQSRVLLWEFVTLSSTIRAQAEYARASFMVRVAFVCFELSALSLLLWGYSSLKNHNRSTLTQDAR